MKFDESRTGKAEFVRKVSELLKREPGSGVEGIKYICKNTGMEAVEISYRGGGKAAINVSCNSNGATLKEIVMEVYGGGAYGKIRDWERGGKWE